MQDYIDRKIDINAKIERITVKQFDNDSRYLHVTISDADLPEDDEKFFNLTGCSAALYIQPAGSDGGANAAYVTGEIADAEKGIVTFLLPGSVTQTVGDFECEIWIYQGSADNRPIISGKPFLMTVEKSIRSTDAIMASSQFSALDFKFSEIQRLRNEMNALAALADTGGIPAGTLESEVVNIRVGGDGTAYASAGDAVRGLYGQAVTGSNVFINAARFEEMFRNDFNNIPNNMIYPIGLSNGNQLAHSPGTNINGIMITLGRGNERTFGDTQTIITMTQTIWSRMFWSDGWTAWNRQTRIDELYKITKPWQGLKVSVLGDSISTYPGRIPEGHACYYNASGNSRVIASVDSMWWKQLCDLTGAEPLVIEAWSGSCCADYDSGLRTGNAGATAAVDDSRCLHLHNGSSEPDIICVALGCNDYYYNVPLGAWDGHGTLSADDITTWRGAYANTLLKIHSRYPQALVLCFSPWFCVRGNVNNSNHPAATVNVNGAGNTYQDYEDAMREICGLLGDVYIDVSNFGFTRQNFGAYFAVDNSTETGAVTHPNAAGQEILGQSLAAVVRDRAIGYINWLKEGRP